MNLDNVQHPEPLLVPPPPIAQPDPDSAIPAGTTWGQLFAALNVMVVNTVTNTVSVAIPNAVTAALNAALPAAVNAAVTAAITTAVIAPSAPIVPPTTMESPELQRSLPKGVKPPTMDTYNGSSVKQLRPWLNRSEMILQLMGFDLNQPLCVSYAASFLTDTAHSWYSSECDRAKSLGRDFSSSGGFATFHEFADALAERMGDPDPASKARDRLASLRQNTSVKQYADEFQRIVTYIPERHPNDLRHDFIKGLKYRIRELMAGHDTSKMTWHEVRDLAYKFDDAVMSTRPRPDDRRFPRDSRANDPMQLGNTETRGRSSTPLRRNPSANLSSATPRDPLPPLTDALRAELRANNGCFRCRKMNAGHIASSCPGPSGIPRPRSQSPAPSRGRSPSPAKN